MSRHWDRLQGGLRDGVLGAQEAEAQRRSWKGSLASKAAVTPKYFSCATCIQTRVQRALRGGSVTLGYLYLKNPDFGDTCL